MNIGQIAENVRTLLLHTDQKTFIYDLLTAYGKPKASVTRLQAGEYNISKDKDYVLWKNNVFFCHTTAHTPEAILAQMKTSEVVKKQKPRFLITTNFDRFCAYDLKTDEPLDIAFVELTSKFDFFLPWAGMEKSKQTIDSPADTKAAEKMAKLYDLILDQNPVQTDEARHGLNVFLSRLLFCYFAEDTSIFDEKLFSKNIESHTNADGSDLAEYLQGLFKVLNEEERGDAPAYFQSFPYVNGGLFAKHIAVPAFNKRSRELLIRCGIDLDWSEISPDIFGTMFQGVVNVQQRENMGQHYTSASNIMRVIEPLFLNDLYDELEKSKGSQKKLQELLGRIQSIRIFDPACGSGNFLIIAYKELRKLEMEVLNELSAVNKQMDFGLSGIQLRQFFGIELDDFAHEIALLSLWLAEHQMNLVFMKRFGKVAPTLPLKPSGNIICDNATQIDWFDVCPASDQPVYLLGNPPYYGSSLQTDEQKEDMKHVFADSDLYKNLDYIAAWFYKGSQYISKSTSPAFLGFVTTSSICQGEQVSMLWPSIYNFGIEIYFSHISFKWQNNAKKNAQVSCVIVGLRKVSSQPKYIFGGTHRRDVVNINPYLVATKTNIILPKRSQPLADLPEMTYGSKPTDGGHLLMETEDKDKILKAYPQAGIYIKKFIGASEHTKNKERWCLWIEDKKLDAAKAIPPIAARIDLVKKFRLASKKPQTNLRASVPHKFGEPRYEPVDSILIPIHGSERRSYIPFGFLGKDVVASNATQVIYSNKRHVFGLISSRLHNVWIKASCGKIKEDPRYSSTLGYNNFPVPKLTEKQVKSITAGAMSILVARENFSELNLAELYDPKNMPEELLEAHQTLDKVVESCYRSKPFEDDEDRLEHLFKMYEQVGVIHA